MITETDSLNTVEFKKYYVITPAIPNWNLAEWIKNFNGKPVPVGFKYNSGSNTEWLSPEDLRVEIKKHVDPDFSVK
jgi:UDP-N-acetylglucosamine 4,6-dehydratase